MRILRATVLVLLCLLEVGFIAASGKYPLPRREAELKAFSEYMHHPDSEKKRLWLEQRKSSEHEVMVRRIVIFTLAIINGVIIVVLLRSWPVPVVKRLS